MKIRKTNIEDLYLIEYNSFKDSRGNFVKTIHKETFDSFGLDSLFKESFYSISDKNVIRGMHFQIPPDDHCKLVYVVSGKIMDVVLDIRKDSKTFGNHFSIEVNSKKPVGIYIGKGLAHGFMSMEDNSIVEYHTTTSHSKLNETGIRYDSFGLDWSINNAILSDRDLNFQTFRDFKSPF